MLRNKIPLHRIFGIAMIGLSILPLALFLMILDQSRTTFKSQDELIGLGLLLLIGGGFLLAGLAYILGLNWARIVTNIILVISFAVLAFPIYYFFTESIFDSYWKQTLEQAAVLICALSILFGVFLFVNNVEIIENSRKEVRED